MSWLDMLKRKLGPKDGDTLLHATENCHCRQALEGHTDEIYSVALSADRRWALSGGKDGTVRLWDLSSGQCDRVFKREWGVGGPVNSVALSADGRRALSGGQYDDTVCLWFVPGGCLERKFKGHEAQVNSVALSADGRCAVSGGSDHTVRLWDLNSGAFGGSGDCLKIFKGHTSIVETVALSRDGRWAVSGSWDGTILVWDLNSGNCVRECSAGQEFPLPSHLALSADGRWVVSSNDCRTLRLWDLNGGRCVRVLTQDRDLMTGYRDLGTGDADISGVLDPVPIYRSSDPDAEECIFRSLALSANGRWVMGGGTDAAIRIWDLKQGCCLGKGAGHARAVVSVALSTDGCLAVSGSVDGTLRVWEVEVVELDRDGRRT
jgi:WD40 repeat protein